MKLTFNRDQLLELMKDFFTLSGIRIVLFDDEYHELLAYPAEPCSFCWCMKADPAARRLCEESDMLSFRQAEKEKKLILYHCHAGLIEATIPLEDNHVTIGYLMFGQLSDLPDRQTLESRLAEKMCAYHIRPGDTVAEGIPLKNREQIHAAVKIMEVCTQYALFSQTVSLKKQRFSRMLRAYLLEHLSEPLQAQAIADALSVSRSKLYQQCQQYLGMGVGEYTKKLRLEQARTLLRDTDCSVTEIACRTGFADYNYFCRVFKNETGVSARKYRVFSREISDK